MPIWKNYLASVLITLTFLFFGFGQEASKGTAYGILIDNTRSLMSQLDREKEFAKAVVSRAKEDSPISLFIFLTEPNSDSRFVALASGAMCSKDRELVNRQIDSVSVAIGSTTLLNAIHGAAEAIGGRRPKDCDESTDRFLILITDGEDRASSLKKEAVIKSLKLGRVRVLIIALVDQLSEEVGLTGKSPKQTSKEFLEKLAKETGGKVVYPKRKQKAEDVVNALFL